MCTRYTPLTKSEVQAVIEEYQALGRAHVQDRSACPESDDMYPGRTAPIVLSDGAGSLEVVEAIWGFPLENSAKRVFNTRIETALEQLESGYGLWSHAIRTGRCLVPMRRFFERHKTKKVIHPKTGKTVAQNYEIRLNHAKAFFVAGVYENGCFSVITTKPNSAVAQVHDRMPLVLGAGESSLWLEGRFADLMDRSGLSLNVGPEQ